MDLFDRLRALGLVPFVRGLGVAAVLWAAFTALRWRRSGLRAALSRSVPEVLVAVGAVAVWAFTVAPTATFLPGNIPQHMPINLVPIVPLIAGFADAEGVRENLPNLAANLVLYAPVGFGLRWRFGLRVWRILLIAAAVSAAVEVSQALSDQLRTPDINDVILNTTSAVGGAWVFMAVSRVLRPRVAPRRGAAAAGPVL